MVCVRGFDPSVPPPCALGELPSSCFLCFVHAVIRLEVTEGVRGGRKGKLGGSNAWAFHCIALPLRAKGCETCNSGKEE